MIVQFSIPLSNSHTSGASTGKILGSKRQLISPGKHGRLASNPQTLRLLLKLKNPMYVFLSKPIMLVLMLSRP